MRPSATHGSERAVATGRSSRSDASSAARGCPTRLTSTSRTASTLGLTDKANGRAHRTVRAVPTVARAWCSSCHRARRRSAAKRPDWGWARRLSTFHFFASSVAARRTAHASGGTAASTSPEGVAPASKCLPSTAKTITRRGSRCRARASSIASWSPNAWVDTEPRNRAGSGSLLASNRRIVLAGPSTHRVDEYDRISAVQDLEQVVRLARLFDHFDPRLRSTFVQSSHDLAARAVVAAQLVSNPITSTGLSGMALSQRVDVSGTSRAPADPHPRLDN